MNAANIIIKNAKTQTEIFYKDVYIPLLTSNYPDEKLSARFLTESEKLLLTLLYVINLIQDDDERGKWNALYNKIQKLRIEYLTIF